jgi:hypothetical protein
MFDFDRKTKINKKLMFFRCVRTAIWCSPLLLFQISTPARADALQDAMRNVGQSEPIKRLQNCEFKVIRDSIKLKNKISDDYISTAFPIHCIDSIKNASKALDDVFILTTVLQVIAFARNLNEIKGETFYIYDGFDYDGNIVK